MRDTAIEHVDHAVFYKTLGDQGFGFGPFLEVVERAYRLADGRLLCSLRADAPQQDGFKRNLQLSAPALAAAHQLLEMADSGWSKAEHWHLKHAYFTSGDVRHVCLDHKAPDGFQLIFLDAAARAVCHWQGIARDSVELPLAAQSQNPISENQPSQHQISQSSVPDNVKTNSLIVQTLCQLAGDILKFPADDIGVRDPFHDLGFDSITLTRYAHDLSNRLSVEISPALFFECEHIEALSQYLIEHHGAVLASTEPVTPSASSVQNKPQRTLAARGPASRTVTSSPADDAIAIIGMAGRFPGSENIEKFFDHLLAGDSLIGDLPLERYHGEYLSGLQQANFVKRGGFLEDVDQFDAAFFKISPVEAERMDPQQRLLLQTVYHALDHAGYAPADLPEHTGVFVGVSALDYAELLRQNGLGADGYAATGNSLAMVANRVSHALNLHGPSHAVDTACSSSLIALQQAAQAIQSGRCDTALVGGVNLCLSREGFEAPLDAGMLSPTGYCKSFGRDADGYVRGEGVATLVVKRLGDAKRDGDNILGVLISGAENHGGHAGSLTAPNVKAQAALVQQAMADIDPRSISYIEAHGTGTQLGDAVEVNGLKQAYAALMQGQSVDAPFIGLGSVKSNIGHLEAAAGLAGVIKVLMAMQQQALPQTLHCKDVSPHASLEGSPFYLLQDQAHWPHSVDSSGARLPRRAAVSSFGFGGANAHVVLEEAPYGHVANRQPRPATAFAQTRYWIPKGDDTFSETVLLAPNWEKAALGEPNGRKYAARHIVPCEIMVSQIHGGQVHFVDTGGGDIGTRYAVMAQSLLVVLQGLMREAGQGKTLIQLVVPYAGDSSDDRELFAGLAGMLETANVEHPNILGQVIEVPADIASEPLASLLASEMGSCHKRVRYLQGHRYVCSWQDTSPSLALSDRAYTKVSLITGGLGGLGRLVATDIAASQKGAVIILTGRSPLSEDHTAFMGGLRRQGATVQYIQADVADRAAVALMVGQIQRQHGSLNAIFHCAGYLRDGYIQYKNKTDLLAVLAPKVSGALALVEACRTVNLDTFVLFSSLAGVTGNEGQADYAAANGFLDALADRSSGKIISINWPLWRHGGMQVDTAVEERLYRQMGQRPLETAQGLAVISYAVNAGLDRLAVVSGDTARIRKYFTGRAQLEHAASSASSAPQNTANAQGKTPENSDERQLRASIISALADLFAKASGFAATDIDAGTPLEEYGIDSLMITRLNGALGKVFGALPKTLFFQYRTLQEIVDYLLQEQRQRCLDWVGHVDDLVENGPMVSKGSDHEKAPQPAGYSAGSGGAGVEPVAIIGISGQYPGGDDLDELWATLNSDTDVISEIPEERWSLDGFYNADPEEAVQQGLSYAKWGGFLKGFADFDPLFFKISPRDAAAMDPQERLFLMSAWAACEDAGYSPERLRRLTAGQVGVFAGVTKTGFALHGPFESNEGTIVRPSTSFASVANRVSHALDISGPSMPVDTMCSSSLTAIHEACAYVRAHDGAMALAGGVNLYLHPSNFVELCAAGMLSTDGRCKSFGEGANGFVPGEGVGCVLLKPLSRAVADGDHIHAVIRGSAVNHGGRNHGYTVPNPAAQSAVIQAAMQQAGVTADEVAYIEAHGTGTALGDPIEVEGLTQAFRLDTNANGFCALGSVKSVMGHLEAAAGIAGLTKIILQMKHAALAPTRHVTSTNPNINFDATPFILQRTGAPWPATKPHIAGLSSFGAGGANVHMIIEAWAKPNGNTQSAAARNETHAVILSARDPEQLRDQAKRLLAFLEKNEGADSAPQSGSVSQAALIAHLAQLLDVGVNDIAPDDPFDVLGMEPRHWIALDRWLEDDHNIRLDIADIAHLDTPLELEALLANEDGIRPDISEIDLGDIAYTLQVGRAALPCRAGFAVKDTAALLDGLRHYVSGRDGYSGLFVDQGQGHPGAVKSLIGDDMLGEVVERYWHQGRIDKVVQLWVTGVEVDWLTLRAGSSRQTVALPTYPFAHEQYWIPNRQVPRQFGRVIAEIEKHQGDSVLLKATERLESRLAVLLKAILANVPSADIIQKYQPWHTAALEALTGFDGTPDVALDQAWDKWRTDTSSSCTNMAQVVLAETALRSLPDVLIGAKKATDVLFPGGSLEQVEAVYKENPIAARFSQTLAQAAAAFVHDKARQTPSKAIRILEIGAGTGGTSEQVFEALRPYENNITEYCYSEI